VSARRSGIVIDSLSHIELGQSLYEADRRRAGDLGAKLGDEMPLKEVALRFALGGAPPHVALVGLSTPGQVREVAELAGRGPLPPEWLERLAAFREVN
jgi:hypothetical protein